MTTADYFAIFVITLPAACVCSFFLGYWRGALMVRKLTSKAMAEIIGKK